MGGFSGLLVGFVVEHESLFPLFHFGVACGIPIEPGHFVNAGFFEGGRSIESDIPLDFLRDLHAAYEDWIERAPAICPVRTIDTEQVNLRDDPAAREALLQMVAKSHAKSHAKAQAAGKV